MIIDWKYALKAAVLATCAGIAAGTATEAAIKLIERKKRNAEEAAYAEEAERYLPDIDDAWEIPEGVNEVPKGKPSFEMEKPNLEALVDYTKFYQTSRKAEDGKDAEEGPVMMHVISEEEFVKGTGNLDGYASVTGTWFADDGILAGWDDALDIKDVDTTVGKAAISKFDDPEVDAVYVRNDMLSVLYEIVRGKDSYEGAAAELSYLPDGSEG